MTGPPRTWRGLGISNIESHRTGFSSDNFQLIYYMVTKPVPVSYIPQGDTFNVGELRMVQLYRRGHLTNTWFPNGTLTEFCATTIQLAIENLVLNKICSCTTGEVENKILFFDLSEPTDFLTCNLSSLEEVRLGYLEHRILKDVLRHPSRSVVDYVKALVYLLLPKKDYTNPGDKIVTSILEENLFQYWIDNSKKILLWKEILLWKKTDIHISELREDEMVTALNNVSLPVINERNHNKAFCQFSDRLYDAVLSQLSKKTGSSG